jgi:glyoxylase-like metal-dependent hydrolase (beta-lactamase superfamily II)
VSALIDLLHLGSPHVIGSYLLEGDGPALVDCGPAVCLPALEAGLERRGLRLTDVRHLLLTHIHPDHAGAAGALVARHPGLRVHVHEIGAPHLVDPERLDRSARRLYGEEFDRLFGPIDPVPEGNVHVLGGRILGLDVVPTPGHASHHVAFFDEAGACYAGDALGGLLPPGRFLYPAAAPPGIDLEAWEASLDAIEERRPSRLLLAHFGEVRDSLAHVERTRQRLREWGSWVESGLPVEEFVRRADAQLDAEAGPERGLYSQLPSFELTYAGIRRYFDKRNERSD